MHVIAMYDIGEKRVGKVLKIFRKYLLWIQYSVFEGDLTEAKLEKLKLELKQVIKPDYDSVIFFKIRSEKALKKESLGKDFDPFSPFI